MQNPITVLQTLSLKRPQAYKGDKVVEDDEEAEGWQWVVEEEGEAVGDGDAGPAGQELWNKRRTRDNQWGALIGHVHPNESNISFVTNWDN